MGSQNALALKALTVHVVSDNTRLRSGLAEMQRAETVGPFQFEFCSRDDGMQPLLEPGLDALVIDVSAGGTADLDFLRRVIALGPDAPVIAIGRDDPHLQMLVMSAGAEDCLDELTNSPRMLALAIRRAIARHQTRDARKSAGPAGSIDTRPSSDAPKVTLVQESSDAIVILDNRGQVRFANDAAGDLFGRDAAELVGKPFGLPSDVGEHEVAVMRPDGDNRFAEMRIIETRWGGTPARIAALNDVTVRHMLERTMQAAKAESHETKKRSQHFFSNVNHDLRTPLTHIIGFSELMKNEQFGPMGTERYRDYASDIHSSGTMLLDMIEDLLGIAEAETDAIDLTDEICNLGQLVDIAVTSQRAHADQVDVKLDIECPARLSGLRGDARRLRQGLFRLIAEAVHSAHRGSTLKLRVDETPSGISVSISEVPLAADDISIQTRLPHLADDPFVSMEHSGVARDESLALSLTRKVMEMHGGTLKILHDANAPLTITLDFPADRVMR